jgi:hypothetical protein
VSRTDRLLIATFACLALATTPFALALEGRSALGGETVIIEGPAGASQLSLGDDATVTIDGSHGPITVETRDGAVRVAEAACPDHTCVKTGWVRAPGSAILCLPNGVTVRIGGARDDGLDAVVR